MEYPSLLYLDSSELSNIDISVFEDLQLLNFIHRRFAEAVLLPCNEANALPREEIFRMLEKEDFKKKTATLYDSAKEICRLDALYNEARFDLESAVVFSALICAVISFAKASKDISDGVIFSRFSSAFSSFLASLPNGIEDELEELAKMLSDCKKTSFGKCGQELKLEPSENETYITKLGKCAEKLGLDITFTDSIKPKQLSTSILAGYKQLYSKQSEAFLNFYNRYKGLYNPSITKYETELGFYLSFNAFFEKIRSCGIPLLYPQRTNCYEIKVKNAYDVSLLAKDETNIVPNDIEISEKAPFFFLTGANGGGKTTYLRAVGITVLLCLLGCPVPCESAIIGKLDGIYTHFPHDERFDGTGRFVEEKTRVDNILAKAGKGSVVLLNETFSSTNEANAVKCTSELAETLFKKGVFGLYITHQHAIEETEIPYLNVLIDTEDENRRTYKVVRQKANGGSFALDILKKYSLTKEALEKRFETYGGGECR